MVKSRRTGEDVWSCKDCAWTHREEAALRILEELEGIGDIVDIGMDELGEVRRKVLAAVSRGQAHL